MARGDHTRQIQDLKSSLSNGDQEPWSGGHVNHEGRRLPGLKSSHIDDPNDEYHHEITFNPEARTVHLRRVYYDLSSKDSYTRSGENSIPEDLPPTCAYPIPGRLGYC
jgi:hypothetical protein